VKVGWKSVPGGWTGVENHVLQILFLFLAERKSPSTIPSGRIYDLISWWADGLWLIKIFEVISL